ncbi:MAG: type II toxin-antitoxin system RelE/ParE family toxin [Bacteroidota bacterium]
MNRVVFRQKAIDDLSDIWEYTVRKWSENQADKYYQTIIKACQEIGRTPDVGRKYNAIRQNLFGFKTGKHIIFYQLISERKIEVIRILHEQMDLKNRLID